MKSQFCVLFFLSLTSLLSGCGPGTMPAPGSTGPVQSTQVTVFATPTPHVQTYEEGVALENQMAKEAEEKAKRDQEPGNAAQKDIENIDRSIEQEREKVEGSN